MTTLALDNPNPALKADERVASAEFTEDTLSVTRRTRTPAAEVGNLDP